MTNFHTILIKTIRLRERASLMWRTYGRTGVTLNAPAINNKIVNHCGIGGMLVFVKLANRRIVD